VLRGGGAQVQIPSVRKDKITRPDLLLVEKRALQGQGPVSVLGVRPVEVAKRRGGGGPQQEVFLALGGRRPQEPAVLGGLQKSGLLPVVRREARRPSRPLGDGGKAIHRTAAREKSPGVEVELSMRQ
jgi:hypothetical protein